MIVFLLPAALQSTCCLPEPWTKHITAPKQHGILLYLPTAAPVLPPNPSLLRHPSYTHTHTHFNIRTYTRIHSPHIAHLNECTEGCGDVQGNKSPLPPSHRGHFVCSSPFIQNGKNLHFFKITHTVTPVLDTPL